MKIVADTNVIVSGILFGGVPGVIIDAWLDHRIEFLITEEILEEYSEVGNRMVENPAFQDYLLFLRLLVDQSPIRAAVALPSQICSDPDDDKFLACALGGGAEIIVSGDKALLECTGYRGITILSPREFVETYLNS